MGEMLSSRLLSLALPRLLNTGMSRIFRHLQKIQSLPRLSNIDFPRQTASDREWHFHTVTRRVPSSILQLKDYR